MSAEFLSRRSFLLLSGGAALARTTPCQTSAASHANIAAMERPRVLAEAASALTAPILTLVELPPPGTAKDLRFYSEAEDTVTASGGVRQPPFRAHAEALRRASALIAALTAAYLLTTDPRYGKRAGLHLSAWLVTPDTRMEPEGDHAGCGAGSSAGTSQGIVDLVPLAEMARALSLLTDANALDADTFGKANAWFTSLGTWLDGTRIAALARDSRDHRASAWLLLRAAIARSQREEKPLEAARARFRAPTLRNQITTSGSFPHELTTRDPLRNSLFNFDLLAGTCQLLASPFDPLWTYDLLDGTGLRAVAAFLYPSMSNLEVWPYIADAAHFRQLPGPRPAILFAGRAYDRPEYVALWERLAKEPVPEDTGGSFPIRQPLLWTVHAPHGL